MPIYEYLCGTCDYRFEVQQKVSDPPLTTCSRCGNRVSKVISAPAIMFKGSGWYITDYSDKLKPPASPESGNGTADGKKDGAPATQTTGASAPAPSGPSTSAAPAAAGSTNPASPSSTSSSS